MSAWLRLNDRSIRGYVSAVEPPIIVSDPEILGGTPVFAGTRVPVQTLLDYLEAGETLDSFLEGFPSVTRELAVRFLRASQAQLIAASR